MYMNPSLYFITAKPTAKVTSVGSDNMYVYCSTRSVVWGVMGNQLGTHRHESFENP